MSSIDFESLYHAMVSVLDESIHDKYDFDSILKTAKVVWDGTGVEVKSNDFVMVFDLISYELLDYTGYDSDGGDDK